MSMKKEYLGDGVYVAVEDGQFVLTAEAGLHPANTIFLEPEVVDALIAYVQRADRYYSEINGPTE